MGLDCSHNAWHGGYISFNVWRNEIAKCAGYAIASVKYNDYYHSETILIDWGHITEENLQGEWKNTPEDPLIVLIAHSDCDGVIHPNQAILLADALEKLIPELPDEEVGGHIGNWKDKTRKFIDGLRLAVERNEDLLFL